MKYFKSSDWEEKFISFSSTFRRLQRATQQVLAIRMTFTTEKTAAGVERLEKKVDDLLRTKTDQEKKLTDAIKKNNGPENCLGSPAIMKELLQLTDDSRVAVARDGKQFDFATLVYNLRRPLDSVLQENLDGFRRLLEEHKKDLTTAIEDLPPRILEAFSVGAAYKRLKDLVSPDVQIHEVFNTLQHVSYVWEHEVRRRLFPFKSQAYCGGCSAGRPVWAPHSLWRRYMTTSPTASVSMRTHPSHQLLHSSLSRLNLETA